VSSNGLSPEEVETLIKDDKAFRTWTIQQLVALNKKIERLESRQNTLNTIMSSLLGFVITLVVLILGHLIK